MINWKQDVEISELLSCNIDYPNLKVQNPTLKNSNTQNSIEKH